MFSRKCDYCGGKNLYLKRTSPMEVLGCRDCEKEVKYLEDCGMSREQIKRLFEQKKRRRRS